MKKSEKHIFISGRVQGVGFRHFTKSNAKKLGLTGWVKNLPDGRVEVLIQGSENQISEMLKLLEKGPPAAKVTSLSIAHESDAADPEDLFRVAY
jgi:acylphosphatase